MKTCVQTGNVVDVLGFERGYAEIKNAGFGGIDWSLDHAVKYADIRNGTYRGTSILEKSLDEVIAYYSEELSYINKNGLEINQAHAPFPTYMFQYPDTLDFSIEFLKRNIEYCDYAQCKNLVVHVIQRDWGDTSVSTEDLEQLNLKLYTSLIPTLLACKNKVTVCLENSCAWRPTPSGINEYAPDEFSCPKYASYFIDKLNDMAGSKVFGYCYDTGHGNLIKKGPAEYIKNIGERLSVLHIHDNDGISDEHMMPFTGTIDWNEFCQSLKEIDFKGNISFETFRQTDRGYKFSEEMCLVMLQTIGKIGELFVKRVME